MLLIQLVRFLSAVPTLDHCCEIDNVTRHRKARFYQQTTKWIPAWVMAVMLAGLYSLAPVLVASFSMSAGEYASIIKSFLKLKCDATVSQSTTFEKIYYRMMLPAGKECSASTVHC
eukprot:SAG31_NODE_678_length_12892_cov_5.458063_5_plen_116_part_00